MLIGHKTYVASQHKLIANLVKIQNDGTVEVDLEKSAPVASELLEFQSFEESTLSGSLISESKKSIPQLQIVILVVGTRGDVQPFLAVAKRLQACLDISIQFILVVKRIEMSNDCDSCFPYCMSCGTDVSNILILHV